MYDIIGDIHGHYGKLEAARWSRTAGTGRGSSRRIVSWRCNELREREGPWKPVPVSEQKKWPLGRWGTNPSYMAPTKQPLVMGEIFDVANPRAQEQFLADFTQNAFRNLRRCGVCR